MIQGLAMLLQGWLPFMSVVHMLFVIPYFFITAIAVLGITYWLVPPVSIMSKEYKKGGASILLVGAYTVFAVLLFAYIKLGDKIF